jgi:membrane associated rhomboid family serine protease
MMQLAQTGVAGFLVQWATDPASPDPTIGASGAIAVMLGAYLATRCSPAPACG